MAEAGPDTITKHNPHPDFKKVEGSRPDFGNRTTTFTKTPLPTWKFGSGGNDKGASLAKNHVEIDPYEEGRPANHNYKLMISGVIPRPIAFLSTVSADGTSTNLAPFSFFNMVASDPPLMVIGFSCPLAKAKDSLRNLLDTKECVVNIISEHFVEAANSTSINNPYGVSEWSTSGLTPAPSSTVKPCRVKESVFSIEGVLESFREIENRNGKKTSVLVTIEGTRFWVREDALNEDKNLIDPEKLRPIARLGGITYGRTVDMFELLRPDFNKSLDTIEDFKDLVKPKVDGQ